MALDQSKQLAKLVARRAIQTTDTQRTHLPLDKNKRLLVVVLRPHQTHLDPAVLPLGAFVKNLFSQCQYVELPPSSTTVDYDRIQQQGLETEQVVIAMVVKPAAWHRFGLLPEQDNFVRDLISRRDYILVSLGSPVALESYSAASERIGTFSDVYGSQEALAEYLCGNSSHLKA